MRKIVKLILTLLAYAVILLLLLPAISVFNKNGLSWSYWLGILCVILCVAVFIIFTLSGKKIFGTNAVIILFLLIFAILFFAAIEAEIKGIKVSSYAPQDNLMSCPLSTCFT